MVDFAARLEDIDVARLAADPTHAAWGAVEDAWRRHPILVFPDQAGLGPEEQAAFVAHFGPVLEERVPGQRHSFVTNADGHDIDDMGDAYRFGALTPHMDFTYTRFPADGISLFALAIPEAGARTIFYSNVLPLERMPRTLREEIDDYHVRCVLELDAPRTDRVIYREGRARPGPMTQSHEWPLVRSHPRRPGTRMLFCTHQQTERILELSDEATDDAASRALLGRLFDEFLYTEENSFVHEWREADLVFWDNLAVQHEREATPRSAGERTLRRVSFCVDGSGIEETVRFLAVSDPRQTFA